MTVRANYDDAGDPASGEREDDKFYAADAKEHAQAINASVTAESAIVATSESTNSTSYTDLTTTTDQVTATVPASGKVLLVISVTATYVSGSNGESTVSVALSGANTQAASDSLQARGGTTTLWIVRALNLTPGDTTFKLKYKTTTTGGTPTYSYSNRSITVLALP